MKTDVFADFKIDRELTLINKFYQAVAENFDELDEDIITSTVFGNDSTSSVNSMNELHYLLCLLLIIQDEIYHDEKVNQSWFDRSEYIERYKIDCIRKYFDCKGINIVPMLGLVSMHTKTVPDGIGYMHIEGNSNDPTLPNFRIF